MKFTPIILAAAALAALSSGTALASGPAPVAPGCPLAGTIEQYDGLRVQNANIRGNFNRRILCNLQHNPNVNAMIAAMAPVDLARLSTQVDVSAQVFASSGAPPVAQIQQVFAQRLSAANLIKVRSAMGIDTDTAVSKYSSLAVQSAYFSAVHPAPLKMSRAQILSNGLKVTQGTVTVQGTVVASPVLDMTVYEVYLEYYTAGWTATASAAAAATYIGGQLAAAYAAGYAVGTGLYWIADTFDPAITIWIGDQIGGFVTYICKGGKCTKQ